MNYALDITNSRVKSAMETLGVEKDELLVKSLNDFGNKGTRDEIKQLRFDYYTRRLDETVKLLRNIMQMKRPKTKEITARTIYEDEESDILTDPPSQPDKKLFLNERNKGVLITALEEIKDFHIIPEKKRRPKSMGNTQIIKNKNTEKFKKTQVENYNRILDSEEMKVRKALSQSYKNSNPSAITPKSRNVNQTIAKKIAIGTDLDIIEKLAKFDEKIEKSRLLHEQQVLMKKESARTQQSFGRMNSVSDEAQDSLIIKMIEKSRAVSERREKRKQELQEKWEKLKSFKEERTRQIEQIEKQFRRRIEDKELSLEKKLLAAEKSAKNRKASLGKEIELRIEQQKLRDQEALIKLKRAHKQAEKKRENIIEKQISDSLKFESSKVSKEIANSKKRDQAIQEMIEKERVQEVISMIKKSPQSKVAVELLREFKLMPVKKNDEEEDNN